jgi:hypothetical protein
VNVQGAAREQRGMGSTVTHHANDADAESTRSTVPGGAGGLRPWSGPRLSDRLGRPPLLAPLPERSAAEPLITISHRLPKGSKACPASGSLPGGGATARQGGDSPNGPFPGPSGSGVFPDPKAGAAANFATPRSVFPSCGTRARNEQRGRPIQRPRRSHPQAWAARACLLPGTATSASSLAGRSPLLTTLAGTPHRQVRGAGGNGGDASAPSSVASSGDLS